MRVRMFVGMTVEWLTAFVDFPPRCFDDGVRFWCAVTASALSPSRGDNSEFATLLPATGDAYLRVQRVGDGGCGRVHIDLHVERDGILERVAGAQRIGANLVPASSYSMTSPAGLAFCFVTHHGESQRPEPTICGTHRELVDQICVDVPARHFEVECAFWSVLTGWELRNSAMAEFAYLERPGAMPLRVLLQRLGHDDPSVSARAHLDVACGDDVMNAVHRHVQLGATVIRVEKFWTTMCDLTGMLYCLTSRDPDTGVRSA